MNKKNFLITIVLCFAILLVNIPQNVYASFFEKISNSLYEYTNISEEEIYEESLNKNIQQLIIEIKNLEKEIEFDEKIVLLPQVTALIEKGNILSEDEIIKLLLDQDVDLMLEQALIRIYINNKYDSNHLMSLITNDNLCLDSQEFIVSQLPLSKNKLIELYQNYDDYMAIIAMTKLIVLDSSMAYNISKETLLNKNNKTTDDKLIASCIGIGEYYNLNKSIYTKDSKIDLVMKELINTTENSLVKDNAVYALSKMHNFENFKYIIDHQNIDFELKVSTIEENTNTLISKINSNFSENDMQYISKSMKLHPILEVGEALKLNITAKNKTSSNYQINNEILDLIKYIEKNGIRSVKDYEK